MKGMELVYRHHIAGTRVLFAACATTNAHSGPQIFLEQRWKAAIIIVNLINIITHAPMLPIFI